MTYTETNLGLTWFPFELAKVEQRGTPLLDMDLIPTETVQDLVEQFHEEMEALSRLVPETQADELADWQKGDELEGSRLSECYKSEIQRRKVLELWERFCVPLRMKNDRIYDLRFPEGLDEIPGAELFSVEPYVTSIKVQDFLVAVAEKTSQNTIEIYRLRNRLSNWRAIAGITSFVLLLILIYLISP